MPQILIIEDDVSVLKMLKQMLEREGFVVSTASDGNQGIKQYCQEKADVVITDIIMPDKEGIETITDLKRQDPEAKIIAISGGGRNQPEDYLLLAQKLGARFTFKKPVDRQRLLSAIKDCLDE
jgi:DNA-binding NtrC family response regulator